MLPVHLADSIREQILFYLQSTFVFRDRGVEEAFVRFLLDEETGLFKGPWVQLRRPFRLAGPLKSPLFEIVPPFQPFRHQVEAWKRLSTLRYDPQSTIITTGTGSGKTECFLYPILDHCLRMKRQGMPGIKAIILYPMNALAADQEKRFARTIWENSRLRGIRVGNYTGRYGTSEGGSDGTKVMGTNEGISDHETQLKEPPDILLTNYKMLDYLLMRPRDQRLWRYNGPEGPGRVQYLVLDELHTYDGAQGADVACLIRRLKERLGIARGRLCMVGTSATLDEREPQRDAEVAADAPALDIRETCSDRLARFASTLFEEEISGEAVIGEDRLTVEEMVAVEPEEVTIPAAADCRPRPGEDAAGYAARLAPLWGGPARGAEGLERWQVALGGWVRRTVVFRTLLELFARAEGAGEGMPEWGQIVERLALSEFPTGLTMEEQRAISASFFALLALARDERDGRAFPLLPTQAQLWIRELRRLGRRVDVRPVFAWLDEAGSGADSLPVLPAFHCSECGEAGWVALHNPTEDSRIGARGVNGYALDGNPSRIYRAWFGPNDQLSPELVIIAPWVEPAAGQQSYEFGNLYLCPHRLVIREGDGACPLTEDPRRFRVRVDRSTRRDEATDRIVGDQGCPACGSREGLMFIGSQAATLASVAIDELFGSTLNSDPKLLAFTDSVQDASHRAGFFTARTYHFTLRTALQRVIDETGPEGLPLTASGAALLSGWTAERPGWSGGVRKAMATLMPPDLQEYPDFVTWRNDEGELTPPPRLQREIEERLTWEVTSEFGLMLTHGRTMEMAGSACLGWDESVIDQTVTSLLERLPGIDSALTRLPTELVRRWLYGILHRGRLRGAIDHPWLNDYARLKYWGKFPFGRTIVGRETCPPAGRYRPALLVTQSQRGHDHVLAETRGGQSPWQIVWARRSLDLAHAAETTLLDLIAALLREGSQTGLFRELYQDGLKRYYVIAAGAARLLTGGVNLHSPGSKQPVVRPSPEADYWVDGPSIEYHDAGGRYGRVDFTPRQHNYQDRYRKGALRRVVAREHTGLLDTTEREALERDFARQSHGDDPNVIACTSTLEMGIDIGDLSSTMLCAIPPNTAGYLQRIGRAGRATGTALIVSLINQRPHDLFFYGRPVEMLRGKVDPPGCWLDASAVLGRQYLAFAVDTATAAGAISDLPRTARQMIDDLALPEGHLSQLLDWIDLHETELRGRFLRRFRENIQDDTRERLGRETRTDLLRQRILQAAAEIETTLHELDNSRRRLRDQLNQLEADESDARREINRELQILAGRARNLGNTPALEILTDRGLLPNYAFPEQGIPFYGTIYNRLRQEQDDHREIDITRPAGAGLRELAPANHFYTHRRRFDIQQIAIGNAQNPLDELWAVCGACGHLRRVSELAPGASACPQCGHDQDASSQSDRGQQRRLLEFARSTALSHMEHYESLSGDHREERDRERYQLLVSFDLTREAPRGAVGEESLPFGIEYRAAVTMREINTGYQDLPPIIPFGIDQKAPEEGFRVCADCGIIFPLGHQAMAKVVHRRSCTARRRIEKQQQEGRQGGDYNWTALYLYRELESEAIRLLLPIADPADLETLTAAIILGLRLRFEGDPDHLLVLPHAMPDPATRLPRYYLVLMDAVPGGTGYLKTLYQERDDRDREGAGVLDILRRAKMALETCVCRQVQPQPDRPDTDGCYRCLRTYRRQHNSNRVSRERAIVLLGQLISAGERRQPRQTLDELRSTALFESQLEKRFVDRLREYVASRHGTWEQAINRGRAGYRFTLPAGAGKDQDRIWELELQTTLPSAQGVAIQCRPDFILRTDDDSLLPMAIFTDGFEFHCHPHNRLADDVQKRRAILESGRYRVWSLTWEDLDPAAAGPSFILEPFVKLLRDNLPPSLPLPDIGAALGNGMEQLLAYLAVPNPTGWNYLATLLVALPLRQTAGIRTITSDQLYATISGWQSGSPFSKPPRQGDGEWVFVETVNPDGDLVACQPSADSLRGIHQRLTILARLSDAPEIVERGDFRQRWRRLLATLNLFQFRERFTFVTTSEAAAGAAPELDLSPTIVIPVAWESLLTSVTPSLRRLTHELAERGAPLPLAEYYLEGIDDEVFAELAWPQADPPVAILAGEQATLAAEWQRQGWRVVTPDDLSSDLIESLVKA